MADMQISKLVTFTRHGFNLAWSYKLNFAAHYVSTFVSVLFFFFLDQMFGRAGVTVVEGGSYFTFLLIGSTISRYLDLGMRSFGENLREEMLRGTIEPLLATATPALLALLGPSLWMLLEGTLLVCVQFLVGALLGADLSAANWFSALVVSLVSLSCLLCYGILSASFTLVFKRSDPLNWLLGSVSYVFSGVFFPISILPPALRVVSYLLPFTYAVHGLRGALMQGTSVGGLATDVLALLGFTLVLLPLSVWSMRAAIHHLKQTGGLTHY